MFGAAGSSKPGGLKNSCAQICLVLPQDDGIWRALLDFGLEATNSELVLLRLMFGLHTTLATATTTTFAGASNVRIAITAIVIVIVVATIAGCMITVITMFCWCVILVTFANHTTNDNFTHTPVVTTITAVMMVIISIIITIIISGCLLLLLLLSSLSLLLLSLLLLLLMWEL